MNELILHVGMHKTATSSIQKTLYENKNFLEEKGFYYPSTWGENHSIEVYSCFCDNPLSYHINIKKALDEFTILEHNKNIKNLIINELKRVHDKKIIISGEDISILNIENIRLLKEFIEEELQIKRIKVIFSVREVISFYTSNTQETIKGGLTLPKYQFGQKDKIYSSRLEKFRKIFGKENIIIYKFEDTFKSKYGPVGFFLEKIGLNNNDISNIKMHKSNEGISDKAIDLIHFINTKVPLFLHNKLNPNRSSSDVNPFFSITGKKYRIDSIVRNIISHNTKEDVLWLKDNFGIDYSNNLENNNDYIEYDDNYYNEIINIYKELSPIIKRLVYEYILEKMNTQIDNKSIIILNKLLNYIISNEFNKIENISSDLQQISQKDFNILGNAETLKEIAFSLEKENRIDLAYFFMSKALEIRPNGPIIKGKILEYQKKLSIK